MGHMHLFHTKRTQRLKKFDLEVNAFCKISLPSNCAVPKESEPGMALAESFDDHKHLSLFL